MSVSVGRFFLYRYRKIYFMIIFEHKSTIWRIKKYLHREKSLTDTFQRRSSRNWVSVSGFSSNRYHVRRTGYFTAASKNLLRKFLIYSHYDSSNFLLHIIAAEDLVRWRCNHDGVSFGCNSCIFYLHITTRIITPFIIV